MEKNQISNQEVELCSVCGKEATVCVEGVHFCEDCASANTRICGYCGEPVLKENTRFARGYGFVCDACMEDCFYYCDHCGNYVHDDDWDYNSQMCYDCVEEIGNGDIHDYHSTEIEGEEVGDCKKSWKYRWRGMGVELEIDRQNENSFEESELTRALLNGYGRHIYLEHDGSLENGFEIITYPHTIEEFDKIGWENILQLCKDHGYKSHDMGTCGLHIHFSRLCFGSNVAKQNTAIAKLIYFYENKWDKIVKLSRRTQGQINQWASKYGAEDRKTALKYGKKHRKGRYYAINNTNDQTVEFRMGRGTLNIKSFLIWVDFCKALVRNSKKITWAEVLDAEKWVAGVSADCKNKLTEIDFFKKEEKKVCA